jgi:hypothetical protein
MATAGTAVAVVAAKNPQVPHTPRFSPAAQVAIALLRVAVGLHLPVGVPGQVLRSGLRHTVGQGVDPRRLADQWGSCPSWRSDRSSLLSPGVRPGQLVGKGDRTQHLAALIRADQPPPGLKAADNADSERPAQDVLVMETARSRS